MLTFVCGWFGATERGLAPALVECRSSRIVAYFIILISFLALCNAVVQPVSSQVFETSTYTQMDTATYFTVSVATSNVSVTVLTEQYVTSTRLFTMVNVQFTTLTSYITGIQKIQTPEGAPSFRSSNHSGSSVLSQSSTQSSVPPTDFHAFFGYVEAGLVLQLVACFLVLLTSILLVLRKQK